VALILHTSGTTSRPKIVPLSHRNVCASARNISQTLQLTESDIELHIMPLFHIHGLIAGVLAPMAVGSQMFCTPGFNALKFFGWMKECKPTWYTAVPTMHQTILARAGGNADVIARQPAALHPLVVIVHAAAGDRRTGSRCSRRPLIESYGMTEAAHQMASNPLPPAKRIPARWACRRARGGHHGQRRQPAAAGTIGEIVIRGENVTAGYENNPRPTPRPLSHGWFRTGDQGTMDADGYLTLTGRLKEIINRGGEKVSRARSTRVPDGPPGGGPGGDLRDAARQAGRRRGRRRGAARRHGPTERELRDFAATKRGRLQGAAQDPVPGRDPQGRDRQALQRIGLAGANVGRLGDLLRPAC
jgi:acyl-CoA synthetase (AMP-forming)/AMP-acid ligase II